jgi:HAD superfamily hydrolase (TIGR01509 family)
MRQPAPPFRAVLFDMDGILIDSMPYHFFAWYEALQKYGITANSQLIYEHEGEKWEDTLGAFLPANKRDRRLMLKIFRYRQRIFRKIFRRHLMPGVPGLAAELKKQNYALGLVSGTPVRDIRRLIPARLLKIFDCVIGGDSVARGKPAPDPYLSCAAGLRLKPAECLVIENAPLGIAAAKSAGCRCLAVTTSLPEAYLRGADRICALKDLRAVLFKLLCYNRPNLPEGLWPESKRSGASATAKPE